MHESNSANLNSDKKFRRRRDWREGSSGYRKEVLHRERCPFLSPLMHQTAANDGTLRHNAKAQKQRILKGWCTNAIRSLTGHKSGTRGSDNADERLAAFMEYAVAPAIADFKRLSRPRLRPMRFSSRSLTRTKLADLRRHAVHEDIVSQTRESLALFTEAVNARNKRRRATRGRRQ